MITQITFNIHTLFFNFWWHIFAYLIISMSTLFKILYFWNIQKKILKDKIIVKYKGVPEKSLNGFKIDEMNNFLLGHPVHIFIKN